ncbi:MAG: hypothetical protein GY842_28145 [bacterium]|nr:hypothetical protein [bacterium]
MNALTTKTNTWTLKSGTNKGQRRIWIEGQRLAALGLTRGTRLSRHMNPGGVMTLSIIVGEPPKGPKHTIAGTLDRPILDLSGKWVTKFMGTSERFMVVTMVDESGNVEGLHIAPVQS